MPELLYTPTGQIHYELTRKKVRNLNLRVRADGSVAVSAPHRMPKHEIENFLLQKAGWILKHSTQAQGKPGPAPASHTKEECLRLFTQVSDRIFPLFADLLNGKKPAIKVREMKSRWGVCHIQKRTIVLNTRLADKPIEALEYVVLHEYVHFIHPNHQAGFHAEMRRLMPDYLERRKLLKEST